MTQERSGGVRDTIRTGIGVLTAFKEAIEETIDEAIARGDLSPDRAKTVMKEAVGRIQTTLDEAKERLEPVPRREFEALREEVATLRARIEALEGTVSGADAGDANGSSGAATDTDEPGGGSGTIPVD